MADDKAPNSMRRKRSPAYPYINLQQAIDLATEFYNKEGFNAAPVSVAATDMGYSPTSGSGARVIAALLHFGLLEEEGSGDERQVWLSELAVRIIEAPNESVKETAIEEAALNPTIHREIWDYWELETSKLPSDANMRFTLLKDFGFHKGAVDSVIDEFKETYHFAELGKRMETVSRVEESTTVDMPVEKVVRQVEVKETTPRIIEAIPPTGIKEHTVQLIGQPMARLILPHPLTKRNLQHLIKWLELMEPALTVPEVDYEDLIENDDNAY